MIELVCSDGPVIFIHVTGSTNTSTILVLLLYLTLLEDFYLIAYGSPHGTNNFKINPRFQPASV